MESLCRWTGGRATSGGTSRSDMVGHASSHAELPVMETGQRDGQVTLETAPIRRRPVTAGPNPEAVETIVGSAHRIYEIDSSDEDHLSAGYHRGMNLAGLDMNLVVALRAL